MLQVSLYEIKLAKMAKNIKYFKKFRTVVYLTTACQLFQASYIYIALKQNLTLYERRRQILNSSFDTLMTRNEKWSIYSSKIKFLWKFDY